MMAVEDEGAAGRGTTPSRAHEGILEPVHLRVHLASFEEEQV